MKNLKFTLIITCFYLTNSLSLNVLAQTNSVTLKCEIERFKIAAIDGQKVNSSNGAYLLQPGYHTLTLSNLYFLDFIGG